MKFIYAVGATPLNADEINNLLPKHLTKQSELSEWVMSNLSYGISSIEGASETLSVIGTPLNATLGYVKGKIKEGGKLTLGNEQYTSLAKWYSELPNGTQLYGTQVSDGFILGGGNKVLGITANITKATTSGVLKTFVKTETAATSTANVEIAATNLRHDFKLSESYLNHQIDKVLGGTPYNQSLRELTALEIRLACEELAMRGEGTVMAGAGQAVPIKDINRLINTYGGTSEEWAKMTSEAILLREGLVLKAGTNAQAHYYKNIRTGQIVEIKPKLQ